MEPGLLSVLAASLAGAALGAASGAVPGLHPNLFAAGILAVAAAGADPLLLGCVLVAAGSAHAFTNYLPAAFFGAVDEALSPAALPAHAMLREGRAAEAARLSAEGSLWGFVAGLALLPPLLAFPPSPALLHAVTPWLIAGTMVVLVVTERATLPYRRAFVLTPFPGADARPPPAGGELRDPWGVREARPQRALLGTWAWEEGPWSRALGRCAAALLVAASGVAGLAVAELPMRGPLPGGASHFLPLLAGLFGVPGLLLQGLRPMRSAPAHDIEPVIPTSSLGAASVAGVAAGLSVGFIPGFTSGPASILALEARRSRSPEDAILTMSAVNTAGTVLALAALYTIGRARSGVLEASQTLLGTVAAPPAATLPPFVAAALVGAGVGYAGLRLGASAAAPFLARTGGRAPALCVLAFLVATTFLLTGSWGVLALACCVPLGVAPWLLGLRRSVNLGCLLVPALLASG